MACIQNCNHHLWKGGGRCEENICICPAAYVNVDNFGRPSCVSRNTQNTVFILLILFGLFSAIHAAFWLIQWVKAKSPEENRRGSTSGIPGTVVTKGRQPGKGKKGNGVCRRFGLYLFLLIHGLFCACIPAVFLALREPDYTYFAFLFICANGFAFFATTNVLALMLQSLPKLTTHCWVSKFQKAMIGTRSFRIIQFVGFALFTLPSVALYVWNPLAGIRCFVISFVVILISTGLVIFLSLMKLLKVMLDLNKANSKNSGSSYEKSIQRTKRFLAFVCTFTSLGVPYFICFLKFNFLWETPLIFFTLFHTLANLTWPHIALLMFPTRNKTRKVYIGAKSSAS